MSLSNLVVGCFTTPATLVHPTPAAIGCHLVHSWGRVAAPLIAAQMLILSSYPRASFAFLHRELHDRYLHRWPLMARLWEGTQFNRRQDPHIPAVPFGSPQFILTTTAAAAKLIGDLVGDRVVAAMASFAGQLTPCLQHLHAEPGSTFMRPLRGLQPVPKSTMAFNFGYTEETAARYPSVSKLPNFTRGDGTPRQFRSSRNAPNSAAFSGQ